MEKTESPYIIFRLRARRDELLAALSAEDHGEQAFELDQSRAGRSSRADAIGRSETAMADGASLQVELQRVEAAIVRVENRTYGTCCRCQRSVGRERLQADPTTPFCLACFEEGEAGKVAIYSPPAKTIRRDP